MISHISIRDFATIENTDAGFGPGLNVITGETGAGKSIVVEAISLALGSRADTAFIRTGKDKAIVQLAADADGEEYVLTREVSASGKNLCRVNGEIVTLAQLSALCRRIADIHGQYDHQSLISPENHIGFIDRFAGEDVAKVKDLVASLYAEYSAKKRELADMTAADADDERRRDFMRFELDEIRSAGIKDGEDDELTARISLMQNSEKIYRSLSQARDILNGDEGSTVLSALSAVTREMEQISGFSPEIERLTEVVRSAYYDLEDASGSMARQRDAVVFSPEELDECVERLDAIEKLKRKYGGSIAAVLKYADDTEASLARFENRGALMAELSEQINVLEQKLAASSDRLSKLRKDAAEVFGQRVMKELEELNFNNSAFAVAFEKLPSFTASGTDRAEFMISTNKGEPLKPLAKIASGGEISRVMLAFKKITAEFDGIPSMVFDEIDTGISGATASVVGRKMQEIAEKRQIICITHLPQIASCGDANYVITKKTAGDSVSTTIKELSEEEKVMEVARMIGGLTVTDAAVESARDLIAQSAHVKDGKTA